MVKDKIKIINKTGLHLKPAANFCDEALRYKSLITFEMGNYSGNAKSILSVISGCVKQGDIIELTCEGADEEEALAGMKAAIESGLGE